MRRGTPTTPESLRHVVVASHNSNLRVVRIPGAGHLPWFDDPDRVVDEIERFLTR